MEKNTKRFRKGDKLFVCFMGDETWDYKNQYKGKVKFLRMANRKENEDFGGEPHIVVEMKEQKDKTFFPLDSVVTIDDIKD